MIDDRIRRGLNELAPADPAGAYDAVVGKRVRRSMLRRAKTAGLALAVVLGSVAGTYGLFRAFAASGRPTPATSVTPPVTPSESPTVSPTPSVGRDIGLALRLCHVETLRNIDFLGDGSHGTAWTGAPLTEASKCPKRTDDVYVVAVDVTGDGIADDVWRSLEYCFVCRPYDATDLDGDGDDELVVLVQGGAVLQYVVFDVRAVNDETVLHPIVVRPPGDRAAGFPGGRALMPDAGGDEGFSALVTCDGFPQHTTLIATWSSAPIEGPGSDTEEVHVVKFVIEDGVARIIESRDYTQATPTNLPYPPTRSACGVVWNP